MKGKKYDLIDVLNQFLVAHSHAHNICIVNNGNRLVRVSDIKIDKALREISCYVGQGTFGVPSEIVSSTSLKSTHDKTKDESDVIKYYCHFRIPCGSRNGFAILHAIGNLNVKSWLSDYLGLHANGQLSGYGLTITPLCSKLALKAYLKDADIRAIKVSHYEAPAGADVADLLKDPSIEKTLVLKKEGGFGTVASYLSKGKKRDRLVALSDQNCTAVKADVVFNGRARTISLEGSKTPKAKFYLQEPEVEFDDGMPVRESIAAVATDLIDDLVAED
ncbi:hypothetical protein ABE522_03275 [Stenotrophomonas pennii]|uniref:hypothetical protein n=1 Tax=Stenotrophomonas lacuserhaii TaxID=2760084 RepID=UPI00320B8ED3